MAIEGPKEAMLIADDGLNENQHLILEAIREKLGGRPLVCNACGRSAWEVQGYLGALPASSGFPVAGPMALLLRSFPFAVLLCNTCGQGLFFNLFKLGIAELLGLVAASEGKEEDSDTSNTKD